MRIRLARGLGDDALVVESEIGAAPQTQPHAGPDPKRARRVVLWRSIDARLTADIVVSVGREPEPVREITAYMFFHAEDGILRKRLCPVYEEIVVVREKLRSEISLDPCPAAVGRIAIV